MNSTAYSLDTAEIRDELEILRGYAYDREIVATLLRDGLLAFYDICPAHSPRWIFLITPEGTARRNELYRILNLNKNPLSQTGCAFWADTSANVSSRGLQIPNVPGPFTIFGNKTLPGVRAGKRTRKKMAKDARSII